MFEPPLTSQLLGAGLIAVSFFVAGFVTCYLDVKKKEIYDLDILKSTASEFPEDHKYWIVTHEDGGFNVRYYFLPKDKRKRSIAENELLCKDNVDWYKFEIVGNVYQNPELLSSDLKKLLRRKEK